MRLALSMLLLSGALTAQTFRGGISGNVTDSSAAAIEGAVVKLDSPSTGLSRSSVTTTAGDFSFPDLPLGLYTLTVSKTGFGTKKVDSINVAVSRVTNLGVTLDVAAQTAIVEVSASAITIDTTSTALAGVVDTRTISDLPMNGRDFRQMLKLNPGVSPNSGSVNGNRTSGNNYQIDGADNNDAFHNTSAVNQGGVSGIAGTLLPVEAIDQFAVLTNAGADSGRNGGSAVNLVIKSGTNSVHGSAYYFNRNEALASLSPFQTAGSAKRKIRNDQYGFSLGGPVIRNKTFFFVTGEAQKAIAGLSFLNTVPSDAWVAQANATLAKYGVSVNPVTNRMLSFWPSRIKASPAAANNFLATDQNDYDSYNAIIKVDHSISQNHQISGRYFGGTGKQAADVGIPFREFFQVAPSRMHNVAVILTSTLSPRLVNQVVLGTNFFLQVFNDEDTSYDPIAAGLNTGVTEASLRGAAFLRISGFSGVGGTQPLGRIDTTGHITDNVSYTAGKHQLKFGGEYRRAVLDVFYDTNKRGTFNFDGTRGPWAADAALSAAQKSLADYMAGYVTGNNGASIVRGQLQRDYLQNSFDAWFHDYWQATPTLSLNFGVRYTVHGVLHDKNDSITSFVPGRGFITDPIYPNDLNNFGPRVGFAWTPKRGGKTVLRGSYGFFYDVPPLNFIVANTGLPNGGAAGVHANPGGPAPVYSITRNAFTIESGVPIFGASSPTPPFGTFSISPDFRVPYIQNFNLNVQQQLSTKTLLQVGYVSSLGRHLSLLRNINAPIPGTTGTLAARRPFAAQYPELAAINELNSIGNSNYHSLQTSLRQSVAHGLSFTANYTWGHAIDNGTNVRNALPANSYDLSRERGSANIDVRHIFTGFVSYDVPVPTQRAPRLFKGWQLNGLFTFTSGDPLDILAGTNVSNSFDTRDRVDLVGDPFANVVQPTTGTAKRYFDAAAFARPATGTFGNIGRNVIYGPGLGSVDFSVFKTTAITERVSLQFRAEFFNLFNQTNFANPGTSLAASTAFGLITNTRNGSSAPGLGFGEPRNTQLALKLVF